MSLSTFDTKARFEYQPLDLDTNSTRLIRLLHGRSAEGYLQLKMWHTVLPSEYRCVSYQWGNSAHRCSVLLNGCVFTVGANLYALLQELHSWTQQGFQESVWIDAICIDQSCLVERGHQVQRMGTIYSQAQEVLIWLGDCGELAHDLQSWLRIAHSHECPPHLRRQWDAVRLNPYWKRAWIKQEVLLAKKVTVVLRNAKIDWTVLGSAIAKSGNLDCLDDEHAAHLWSFWVERWRSKHRPKHAVASSQDDLFSFWSLMYMHRTSECTDKRDRVYSLLGLVEGSHHFKVDYKESAADLFWRVGEHFDVGEASELVDVLKAALLETDGDSSGRNVNPSGLVQAVRRRPDVHMRIPIRHVSCTDSFTHRIRRSVRCRFRNCKQSPRLQCTRDDLLICTNPRSDEPTDHGCIHAIAHPLDKPAAEPFEIRLVAHHREQVATTTLLSTAVQVFDTGTETWVGISTWSSLQKALQVPGLDRSDKVKLSVPAIYALWIWFGVHPAQLDDVHFLQDTQLPSAHHALPSGTKITKNSVELPAT